MPDEHAPISHAHGIMVLTLEGDRISAITRFIDSGLPRTSACRARCRARAGKGQTASGASGREELTKKGRDMIEPYQAIGLVPTMRGIRHSDEIGANLDHISHLVKAASWLSSLDLPVRLITIRRSLAGLQRRGP